MFETFALVLRETVEAALIVAIVLAYLKNTGREDLRRWVYLSVVLAVIASLATAGILRVAGAELGEFYEGVMYLVAACLISTMIVWISRTKDMGAKVASNVHSAMQSWKVFGLVAVSFLMIYREGAEIVLFLAAKPGALGEAALAFLIAIGFAYLLVTVRMNMKMFFTITTIMLLTLVFQLTFEGLHELEEAGVDIGFAEPAVERFTSSGASLGFTMTYLILLCALGLVLFMGLAEHARRPKV